MGHEHQTPSEVGGGFWTSRMGVAFLILLASAVFYLLTEHRAHAWGLLPYLVILACPLMHLFMHHGHRRNH